MPPLSYAAPSGPYPVGVRTGQVYDTAHPRPSSRRLAVQVWYPAKTAGGEKRPYFTGNEARTLRWFCEANGTSAEWVDRLATIRTFSVTEAEPADGAFPTLLFSHGALSWIMQNTPLMEHLAGHGYVVCSVAHPGEASGVCYPNGDLIRYDTCFKDTFFTMLQDPDYSARYSADLTRRFELTSKFLDDKSMGP